MYKVDDYPTQEKTEEIDAYDLLSKQISDLLSEEISYPETTEEMLSYLVAYLWPQQDISVEDLRKTDSQNPHFIELLYAGVIRAEEYLDKSFPHETRERSIGVHTYLNTYDKEKYEINIIAFTLNRIEIRKAFEDRLQKDAEKLTENLPEKDKKLIENALDKISISVPMSMVG